MATLDTAGGPVRVGVMICFDREFPESARALMLGGAEVIVTPNACPLTDDRVGQFRARAFENMLAAAMASYPRFGGRSCVFDGIAFAPDGGPRDHRVAEAAPGEGIVLARLDLDALRFYRQAGPLADAYRRPRWSYRQFVWVAPPASTAGHTGGRPWPAGRPPQTAPDAHRDGSRRHSWRWASMRADMPGGQAQVHPGTVMAPLKTLASLSGSQAGEDHPARSPAAGNEPRAHQPDRTTGWPGPGAGHLGGDTPALPRPSRDPDRRPALLGAAGIHPHHADGRGRGRSRSPWLAHVIRRKGRRWHKSLPRGQAHPLALVPGRERARMPPPRRPGLRRLTGG